MSADTKSMAEKVEARLAEWNEPCERCGFVYGEHVLLSGVQMRTVAFASFMPVPLCPTAFFRKREPEEKP